MHGFLFNWIDAESFHWIECILIVSMHFWYANQYVLWWGSFNQVWNLVYCEFVRWYKKILAHNFEAQAKCAHNTNDTYQQKMLSIKIRSCGSLLLVNWACNGGKSPRITLLLLLPPYWFCSCKVAHLMRWMYTFFVEPNDSIHSILTESNAYNARTKALEMRYCCNCCCFSFNS